MQQNFYITREDLAAFTLALDVRIYAGRGWLPLVLSAKTIIGDSVVAAVREDAGALRIELNRCSPPQREWLAEVEAASRMVCEICGKPGQLRFEGLKNGQPAGWHRTRCDEHIDAHTKSFNPGGV